MSDNFIICTRAINRKKEYIPEPGISSYLMVPDDKLPTPEASIKSNKWFLELRKAAIWGQDSRDNNLDRGDILFFVHGYNNDQQIMMNRHKQLKEDLHKAGFKGAVVSFDWPSDNKALNYVEDRHDAKETAMKLVSDGIRVLAEQQKPDCSINIHILAHSTGAYVVREAFDDADDAHLANNSWIVSQIVFIGADISSGSLSQGNSTTDSLYRHCVRLTNYSNLYDSVLKLSNAKRLGMAPRVGREGLPNDAPTKAVNVDCTKYFGLLNSNEKIKKLEQKEELGTFEHSWHIGNIRFIRDLFETLKGDFNHTVLPTREIIDGHIILMYK